MVALSIAAVGTLAPLARAEAPGTAGLAKFLAKGPAGLKIEGKTDALSCAHQAEQVVCGLPLGKFSTGIELRDQHLYKALDSDNFPDARLEVARSTLTLPADGAEASGSGTGSLWFHGQTRPVSFNYTARRSVGLDVSATLLVNLPDFAVEPPSYLGITVRPDVEVTVSFHLPEVH